MFSVLAGTLSCSSSKSWWREYDPQGQVAREGKARADALGPTAPATRSGEAQTNTKDIYDRPDVAVFQEYRWIGWVVLVIGILMIIARFGVSSIPLIYGADMSTTGILATFMFAFWCLFAPEVYIAMGPLVVYGVGGAAWVTVLTGGNLTNFLGRRKMANGNTT